MSKASLSSKFCGCFKSNNSDHPNGPSKQDSDANKIRSAESVAGQPKSELPDVNDQNPEAPILSSQTRRRSFLDEVLNQNQQIQKRITTQSQGNLLQDKEQPDEQDDDYRFSNTLFTDKDHASNYLKFRPDYPDQLYEFLEKLLLKSQQQSLDQQSSTVLQKRSKVCWDVGCGSGQATYQLIKRDIFKTVIGTDVSESQIQEAQKREAQFKLQQKESQSQSSSNENETDSQKTPCALRFHVADCASFPKVEEEELLKTNSNQENSNEPQVDIITVATAAHWFEHCMATDFSKECHRVLKPNGIVAVWCYGRCKIYHSKEDEEKRYQEWKMKGVDELNEEQLRREGIEKKLLEMMNVRQNKESRDINTDSDDKNGETGAGGDSNTNTQQQSLFKNPSDNSKGSDDRSLFDNIMHQESRMSSNGNNTINVARNNTSMSLSSNISNRLAGLSEFEKRRRRVESLINVLINEYVWSSSILGPYLLIQHEHVFYSAFSLLNLDKNLGFELIASNSEEQNMQLRSAHNLAQYEYEEEQAERLCQQCSSLSMIEKIFVMGKSVRLSCPPLENRDIQLIMNNNNNEDQNGNDNYDKVQRHGSESTNNKDSQNSVDSLQSPYLPYNIINSNNVEDLPVSTGAGLRRPGAGKELLQAAKKKNNNNLNKSDTTNLNNFSLTNKNTINKTAAAGGSGSVVPLRYDQNLFELQNPAVSLPTSPGDGDAGSFHYIPTNIEIEKWMTLDEFLCYQKTWSSVHLYMNDHNGENPLETKMRPKLAKLWGHGVNHVNDSLKMKKKVVWPLILRVWRKK